LSVNAPVAPTDLIAAIRPYLRDGEIVLWTGRPPQGFFIRPRSNPRLRGALLLTLFLALSPILILIDPTASRDMFGWTCGIGSIAFFAVLKGDALWRARTVYALTDARVLVGRLDGRGSVESLPIPNEARIEYERDGRATIQIGETPQAVLAVGFKRYLDVSRPIVFQAVEDGRRAYALIRGRHSPPPP
jgi:hypothetical protein